MAHLVHATHEQSYFAHLQMYALCVGPRTELCEEEPEPGTGSTLHGASYGMVLVVAMVTAVMGALGWS